MPQKVLKKTSQRLSSDIQVLLGDLKAILLGDLKAITTQIFVLYCNWGKTDERLLRRVKIIMN